MYRNSSKAKKKKKRKENLLLCAHNHCQVSDVSQCSSFTLFFFNAKDMFWCSGTILISCNLILFNKEGDSLNV